MNQPTGIPFSLEPLWAIEPSAFERLRDLVMNSSHERLAAAAALTTAGDSHPGFENRSGVAVIPFSGVVTKRATVWSQIFGGRAVTTAAKNAVNAAVADPTVKSILMVIDSPGGTIDGTSDLADTVAAANKVKPVTCYAEDMCASAAYWVGSQAGRLVGNPTAAVGSIGVFATLPDVSRLVKNLGVEVNVIKSVPGKGTGTPGTPVTDTQIADMQRTVDAIHAQFVGAVNRGRGKDMTSVADGRIHIGQAAVDNGLLDAIEPLSTTLEAMQLAAQPKPDMMKETPMAETPTPAPVAVDHSADITSLTEKLAAQAKELAEFRASYTAGRVDANIEASIAQARTDRKLTPAIEKSARVVAKNGGLEALNEFLGSLSASAPAGGSVVETVDTKEPGPRNASDHVGVALGAYKQDTAPAHQAAIAYKDKAEQSGRKISYMDAVIAVTRK